MGIPRNWSNTYPLIKTEAELHDLTDETVLRDSASYVYELWGWEQDDNRQWFNVGDERGHPASRIMLPAVVIWAPQRRP